MYTRCPECQTCFRVTDRHLEIANGKVRCGQCQHIFMAPEHAVDDIPINKLNASDTAKTPPIAPSDRNVISAEQPAPINTKQPLSETEPPGEPVPPPPQAKTTAEQEPAPSQQREKSTADNSSSDQKQNEQLNPAQNEFDREPDEPSEHDLTPGISSADDKEPISEDINDEELDNDEIEKINLDDEYDASLTQDIDLDNAIDLLSQNDDDLITKEPVTDTEPDSTENDTEIPIESAKDEAESSIFDTTSSEDVVTSSVSDMLDEVKGQLSLDIEAAGIFAGQFSSEEAKYNPDDEFEFIELDDDDDKSSDKLPEISNGLNKEDEAPQDELVEVDRPDRRDSDTENFDEDELFDEINSSDLDSLKADEDIVLQSGTEDSKEFPGIEDFNDDLPDTNNSDIPIQLRNDVARFNETPARRIHPVILFSFMLILLAGSTAHIAYFRAHDLLNVLPQTRPLLEKFCEHVNCVYSGPSNIDQVELISRNVKLHPKEKNALMITAAIINKAPFAQPYPDIHIKLSDISGNVVAERIFNSKTYMGKLSNPFLLMKSNTPVYINFEVVDPGKDAVNFEFSFR